MNTDTDTEGIFINFYWFCVYIQIYWFQKVNIHVISPTPTKVK